MLNKIFQIVWLKMQMERHHHFCLPLPIALYVFQELLDDLLDILTIARFFAPNKTNPNSSNKINTMQEFVQLLMKFFDSLTAGEPYTLVDVTADKIKFSLRIG